MSPFLMFLTILLICAQIPPIAAKEHQQNDMLPALREFSAHTVIRPEIKHGKYEHNLENTLDIGDGLHVPHITLSYIHEGKRVLIDLQRNDELLPEKHFLRQQDSSTSRGHVVRNFTKTEIDLCHYKGQIRGKPNSRVAISTCGAEARHGINGVIYDGEHTYFIHSTNYGAGKLHHDHYLLRETDMLTTNASCGYNSATDDHSHIAKEDAAGMHWQPKLHLHGGEFKRVLRRHKRSSEGVSTIRGPYNANKYSSYVELVIVVDNNVFKHFDENARKVHQYCKDLANVINALYEPLNIFVALVGVVIWNEANEIELSPDGDVTLRSFLNYRSTKLVIDHPNDNAQLLTRKQFAGGVVGKALKGPMCTFEYSGGVSMQHSQSLAVVATTMAHEMGHNFGMEHDTPDCECAEEKCIMAASSTAVVPTHWSSCSIDQLSIAFSRGMNYCLRNKPTKLFDSPQCGNGFVEPGEQCDCGLVDDCKNPCCDAHTCMLHRNASCATGECCDLGTCRPKSAGVSCRTVENECDLPEYCTGGSEYCPPNVFKRDTVECDDGRAYCFQGSCRSHTNQCRVLWGITGENSQHCYDKNTAGIRLGNCGYNRVNKTFVPCAPEHTKCGMLHCRHLNERLEFGMETAAVLSHSYINHGGQIVPCRTALVDLGLQSTDPGLTPNGAKCGNDRMCVNQKCLSLASVRQKGYGATCPGDCSGRGVCNSRGHCHCDIGYAGAACTLPGPGGSDDSGPASNNNGHRSFQRLLVVIVFCVLPSLVIIGCLLNYCRKHKSFISAKLAENIFKSANGSKSPGSGSSSAPLEHNDALSMPKSTPSSTDDMNSALLKTPNESNDGLYGKFKGFTLRPLNDTATTASNLAGPNVAFVQPTVQQDCVPQRTAPPPPPLPAGDTKLNNEVAKLNGALPNNQRADHQLQHAPALPPPNPCKTTPVRAAPAVPAIAGNGVVALKPAPPPPVPLHTDPKLNLKRDGTMRRIASFLTKDKDDKPLVKEKTYIEREKLRNLEISAPIRIVESSDSDTTPREDETKNLVKRAQSMRSPTKKTNVQSFGSMRSPSVGPNRPRSVVSAVTRPKLPPPRPPALRTASTSSSGYQIPLTDEVANNTYDACEYVEQPSHDCSLNESGEGIYAVIDERSPPKSASNDESSDMSLLGEIVNEIEKRNGGESIYTASTLQAAVHKSKGKEQKSEPLSPVKSVKPALPVKPASEVLPAVHGNTKSPTKATPATISSASNSAYLRTNTLSTTPVARVAPTRSDVSPTRVMFSFKPPIVKPPATIVESAKSSRAATTNATTTARAKSFSKLTRPTPATAKPTAAPSATIQKPKPLSAKPSFTAGQKRSLNTATPTPPTIKSANIESLAKRFEKRAAEQK